MEAAVPAADTLAALQMALLLKNKGGVKDAQVVEAFFHALKTRQPTREATADHRLDIADLYYQLLAGEGLDELRPFAYRFYQKEEKFLRASYGDDDYQRRLENFSR
jgi:hypothetical protein